MSDTRPQRQPEAEPFDEETLALRFALPLRVFALRRVEDPGVAEDVAQETLSRGLQALRAGRVDDPGAIPSFLYETARHVCQHHLRKLGRQRRAYDRVADEGQGAVEPAALARLLGAERCQLVRSALSELSSDDRELLRHLYFDDEPPAAAARRLGINDGTLRVRKHRALARLRAALARHQPDEAAPVTKGALRERKQR